MNSSISKKRTHNSKRKRAYSATGRPQKKAKTWTPYKNQEITVVDEHNNALLPIWRALKTNRIPSSGIHLFHFDSHPDMGALDEDDEELCRSELVPTIFEGKFNHELVHEATCIGTYIPVLVMQGLVNEVTWSAGHWCHQMDEGDFDLVVGQCKETGRLKVATKDDVKSSILEYWEGDGTAAKCDELTHKREWKLHVVKFNKRGTMSDKNMKKLTKLFRGKHWILDIDEDYLSCNNPHGIEFRANFGDAAYAELTEIFDQDVKMYYQYWESLEKLTTSDIYKLPKRGYLNHEITVDLVAQLKTIMSQRKAEDVVLRYRKICLKVFPAKVDKNKWNCEDIYENTDITETGGMSCVPHHITEVPEILNMVNTTVEVFCRIGTPPLMTTVATSRADRYLPDAQSALINTLVLRMLRRQYPGARTTRTDIPENTADDLEPSKAQEKTPLLFRGKNHNGKRLPVSR